jgi:hypothetical protein
MIDSSRSGSILLRSKRSLNFDLRPLGLEDCPAEDLDDEGERQVELSPYF